VEESKNSAECSWSIIAPFGGVDRGSKAWLKCFQSLMAYNFWNLLESPRGAILASRAPNESEDARGATLFFIGHL